MSDAESKLQANAASSESEQRKQKASSESEKRTAKAKSKQQKRKRKAKAGAETLRKCKCTKLQVMKQSNEKSKRADNQWKSQKGVDEQEIYVHASEEKKT